MYRLVQYHLFLTLASICLLQSTNTYKVGALAYAALIAACHFRIFIISSTGQIVINGHACMYIVP